MSEPNIPKKPRGLSVRANAKWEERQVVRLLKGGKAREWVAYQLGISMTTLVRRLQTAGARKYGRAKCNPQGRGIGYVPKVPVKHYSHLKNNNKDPFGHKAKRAKELAEREAD